MKRFLICIAVALSLQSCNLLSAAGLSSAGQPTKEVPTDLTSTTANSAVNVDHSEWNALLKTHVSNSGLVNYEGFKKDRSKLDAYLQKLSGYNPNNDWSVQELLAYYINFIGIMEVLTFNQQC